MDSSVPSILLPLIPVPSTPFKLLSIYIWIVSCGKDENKQKEAEIGPFKTISQIKNVSPTKVVLSIIIRTFEDENQQKWLKTSMFNFNLLRLYWRHRSNTQPYNWREIVSTIVPLLYLRPAAERFPFNCYSSIIAIEIASPLMIKKHLPCPVWPDLAKNSPLWLHVTTFWLCFEGLFSIWQKIYPPLAKMLIYWAHFHCCKWPKTNLPIWSHCYLLTYFATYFHF